jgi:hypothetical protein
MGYRAGKSFEDNACVFIFKKFGIRFVLYQMSKNMNRRLFYMFLVRLASAPRQTANQLQIRNIFHA